ncbi:MAG: hypothetical protein ABW321_25125 [Polyangiales bacterium]
MAQDEKKPAGGNEPEAESARVRTSLIGPVIGREQEAMEEELVRARELLRDGMTKLHGFFDALRSSVNAQSDLLSKLRDETADTESRASTIHQLIDDHKSVLTQSETAILGLQLEDVLGQLLEYTRQRASGLSKIASALSEAIDHDELAQNRALSDKLKTAVDEVDKRSQNRVVDQESLEPGDIDLF